MHCKSVNEHWQAVQQLHTASWCLTMPLCCNSGGLLSILVVLSFVGIYNPPMPACRKHSHSA